MRWAWRPASKDSTRGGDSSNFIVDAAIDCGGRKAVGGSQQKSGIPGRGAQRSFRYKALSRGSYAPASGIPRPRRQVPVPCLQAPHSGFCERTCNDGLREENGNPTLGPSTRNARSAHSSSSRGDEGRPGRQGSCPGEGEFSPSVPQTSPPHPQPLSSAQRPLLPVQTACTREGVAPATLAQ